MFTEEEPDEARADGIYASLSRMADVIARRNLYNVCLGLLNFLNFVCILIETDCSADPSKERRHSSALCSEGADTVFLVFEWIFVFSFVVDYAIRLLARCRYLVSAWGIFDLLMLFGAVAYLVEETFDLHWGALGLVTGSVASFRVFRIFRMARNVGFTSRNPDVWIMLQGLMGALKAVLAAIVIGFLMIAFFGILGVLWFSSVGPEWQSIQSATWVLVKIATFDSWTSSVEPTIVQHPFWGAVYLIAFVSMVAITLFSLVTAVVTERAMASAQDDKERERFLRDRRLRQVRDELRDILIRADKNRDGTLTKREILTFFQTRRKEDLAARGRLEELGSPEEIAELFDLMTGWDPTNCTLNLEIFLDGALGFKQDKTNFLLLLMLRHTAQLYRYLPRIDRKVENLLKEQRELVAPQLGQWHNRIRAQDELQIARDRRSMEKLRRTHGRKARNIDVEEVRRIFDSADAAYDGSLEPEEFYKLFENADLSEEDVRKMWQQADTDDSGFVNFQEFLNLVCELGWPTFRRHVSSFERTPSSSAQLAEEPQRRPTAEGIDASQVERVACIAAAQAAQEFGRLLAEETSDLRSRISQLQETATAAAAAAAAARAESNEGGAAAGTWTVAEEQSPSELAGQYQRLNDLPPLPSDGGAGSPGGLREASHSHPVSAAFYGHGGGSRPSSPVGLPCGMKRVRPPPLTSLTPQSVPTWPPPQAQPVAPPPSTAAAAAAAAAGGVGGAAYGHEEATIFGYPQDGHAQQSYTEHLPGLAMQCLPGTALGPAPVPPQHWPRSVRLQPLAPQTIGRQGGRGLAESQDTAPLLAYQSPTAGGCSMSPAGFQPVQGVPLKAPLSPQLTTTGKGLHPLLLQSHVAMPFGSVRSMSELIHQRGTLLQQIAALD